MYLSTRWVQLCLYVFLVRIQCDKATAFLASLFFAVSPLTTLAVAWSGAIFGRLCFLFTIVTLYIFICFMEETRKLHNALLLFGIFLFSTCVILSKETGVMLPIILSILALIISYGGIHKLEKRKCFLAIITASIPVIAYLLIRIEPLINSFMGNISGSYSPSILNIPSNAYYYFIYPFLVTLTEAT